MNCHEVQRTLDDLEPGATVPIECVDHASACPTCALALRIEMSLREAPRWAERPALSVEARARVLAKAKVRGLFWRQAAPLLEESAVTAMVLAILAAAALFFVPSFARGILPESARRAVLPYLQPLAEFMKGFASSLAPLTHQPWSVALLVGTIFAVMFAAVVSVRTLVPRLHA